MKVTELQKNIFTNMMDSWGKSTDLYTKALEANGFAQGRQEIHLKSTEAKMKQLKTTIDTFWQNTLSSKAFGDFYDGLTKIIEVFGNLPSIIMIASTAILFFSGTAITKAITSFFALVSAEGLASVATFNLALAWDALKLAFITNPIGMIAVAITTVIVAFELFNSTIEDANKKINENYEAFKQDKDAIDALVKTYKDNVKLAKTDEGAKSKLIETEIKLKEMFGESAKKLDLQNKSLKENLDLIDQVAAKKLQQSLLERQSMVEAQKAKLETPEIRKYDLRGTAEKLGIKPIIEDISDSEIVIEAVKYKLKDYQEVLRQTLIDQGKLSETDPNYLGKETIAGIRKEFAGINTQVMEADKIINGFNTDTKAMVESSISGLKNLSKEGKNTFETLKSSLKCEDANKYAASVTKIIDIIKSSNGDVEKLYSSLSKLPELKGVDLNKLFPVKDMENFVHAGADGNTVMKELQVNAEAAANKLGSTTTDTKALALALKEMGVSSDGIKNVEDAVKRIDEIFQKSIDNVQMLNTAQGELSENHKLSAKSMEAIIMKYPELIQHMDNEAELSKAISRLMLTEQENQRKLYINKLLMSEDFFNKMIKGNTDLWNQIKDAYGVDADRFKNLVDVKLAMNQQLTSLIAKNWRELYGSQEAALRDYLKVYEQAYYAALNRGDTKAKDEARAVMDSIEEQLGLLEKIDTKVKITVDKIDFKELDLKDVKVKKEKTGTTAAGVSEPEAPIERDLYYALNRELDKTNVLLEKNEALQASAKGQEKIRLLKEEIELLKRKQENIHQIADLERRERDAKVKELKGKGAIFTGTGDDIMLSNFEELIRKKSDEVNKHRTDKDKTYYNTLKKQYEDLTKTIDRFFDIQEDIPKQQSDFLNLSTSIAKTLEEIDEEKVNILKDGFKAFDDTLTPLDNKLKDLDYQMQLLGENDFNEKTDLLKDKIKETTKEVDSLDVELARLAKVIPENESSAEALKDRIAELTEKYRQGKIALTEYNKSLEDVAKTQQQLADEAVGSYLQSLNEQTQKSIDKIQEEKKVFDDAQQAKMDAIQAEIDATKEIAELDDEEIERKEKLIDLAKKEEELNNIRREKNVKVYRAGQGFVWEADPRALRETTEELQEMQEDYNKWDLETKEKHAEEARVKEIDEIKKATEAKDKLYELDIKNLQDAQRAIEDIINESSENQITTIEGLIAKLDELGVSAIDNMEKVIAAWDILNKANVGIQTGIPVEYNPTNEVIPVHQPESKPIVPKEGSTPPMPGEPEKMTPPVMPPTPIDFDVDANYQKEINAATTAGKSEDDINQLKIKRAAKIAFGSSTFDKNINYQLEIDTAKAAGAPSYIITKLEKFRGDKLASVSGWESMKIMDGGGGLPHGAVAVNLSGEVERVLSPSQTKSFEKMVDGLPNIVSILD
jgi:hypothetical protein